MAASANNSLCAQYKSIDDSAFDADEGSFTSNVFCNPPFSDVKPWVELCQGIAINSNVAVVMVLPADTSVKWFKIAFDECTECHFISGRLSFINAETKKPVSNNNKGTVVFVFDPKSPVKQSVHLLDRESMK